MSTAIAATAPVTRCVRAYFAPVTRGAEQPVIFDAAANGGFDPEAPPAPWTDLGWCTRLVRASDSKLLPLRTGAPAMTQVQVRTEFGATVEVEFDGWGKLPMALCSGSEQMNLLVPAAGAAANGSGGTAAAAVPVASGSTATSLMVGTAAAAGFSAGDLVVADADYAGQTGYVGAGVSGAYVATSASVGGDANYIRRVSLNVGRVLEVSGGALQLAAPLLAGVPANGMQVSRMAGFVDREGGTFLPEWSALFCCDGEQGDRVLFHYPRLQAMASSAEAAEVIAGPIERLRLRGVFRALPVRDANDGAAVLCFRSYLPGPMRAV